MKRRMFTWLAAAAVALGAAAVAQAQDTLAKIKQRGTIVVGSHPEWITLTPDGSKAYLGVAGDDQTVGVDLKTMKVIARVDVGYVPKRIGTLVMSAR